MPDAEALPADGAAPSAVWQERPPEGPWCPAELAAGVPWAATFSYQHQWATQATGPAGWQLLGGTRRGRLHGHRGEFREDACRLVSGENFLALVAADGAGSARWSRVGAESACRTIEGYLRARLHPEAAPPHGVAALRAWLADAVGGALPAAVETLDQLARSTGVSPADLRTTALLAVWWRSALGEFLGTAQVGDGFIVIARADGELERAAAGDVSEFSGEVSCFLPDNGAADRGRAATVLDADDLTAILLGTDGVEDPFYPIERHGPLLLRQLREGVEAPAPDFQRQAVQGPVFGPEGAERLLTWLGFERRGENDDRTLVAAWR